MGADERQRVGLGRHQPRRAQPTGDVPFGVHRLRHPLRPRRRPAERAMEHGGRRVPGARPAVGREGDRRALAAQPGGRREHQRPVARGELAHPLRGRSDCAGLPRGRRLHGMGPGRLHALAADRGRRGRRLPVRVGHATRERRAPRGAVRVPARRGRGRRPGPGQRHGLSARPAGRRRRSVVARRAARGGRLAHGPDGLPLQRGPGAPVVRRRGRSGQRRRRRRAGTRPQPAAAHQDPADTRPVPRGRRAERHRLG